MNKIKDLETIKEIKQGLDHILKTRTTKEAAEWVNANYKEKYLDEFCRFCCFEQSKTTIKLNLGHLRELFREYKTNKEEEWVWCTECGREKVYDGTICNSCKDWLVK